MVIIIKQLSESDYIPDHTYLSHMNKLHCKELWGKARSLETKSKIDLPGRVFLDYQSVGQNK